MDGEQYKALTHRVIGCAMRVHAALGPGMLESAYVACLVYELNRSGLQVETEVPVPVVYDGVKLADVGFRIDILVEDELVLEAKAVEAVAPVHLAQLVSYLRMTGRKVGLLLNFNVADFKKGIYRRVNHF